MLSSHSVVTCPTDVVHAPAPRVWNLIATPAELARWSRTRIIEAPGRSLDVGDRLVVGAGIGHRMRVVLDVQDVIAPRRIVLRIRLPFGVVNNETIAITPTDAGSCRVTLN